MYKGKQPAWLVRTCVHNGVLTIDKHLLSDNIIWLIPNAWPNGCFATQATSRKCVVHYKHF